MIDTALFTTECRSFMVDWLREHRSEFDDMPIAMVERVALMTRTIEIDSEGNAKDPEHVRLLTLLEYGAPGVSKLGLLSAMQKMFEGLIKKELLKLL